MTTTQIVGTSIGGGIFAILFGCYVAAKLTGTFAEHAHQRRVAANDGTYD